MDKLTKERFQEDTAKIDEELMGRPLNDDTKACAYIYYHMLLQGYINKGMLPNGSLEDLNVNYIPFADTEISVVTLPKWILEFLDADIIVAS